MQLVTSSPARQHLERWRQGPSSGGHERQHIPGGRVLQPPAALQQAEVQLAAAAERLHRNLRAGMKGEGLVLVQGCRSGEIMMTRQSCRRDSHNV